MKDDDHDEVEKQKVEQSKKAASVTEDKKRIKKDEDIKQDKKVF